MYTYVLSASGARENYVQMATLPKQPYEIILLGDKGVGKTSVFKFLSGTGSSCERSASPAPDEWLSTHTIALEGRAQESIKV